jgi:DUF2934 family protein
MAQKEINPKPIIGENPQPSQDEIRKRAYEIYSARNGGLGNELDDWLKAETELKQRRATAGKCPGTLEAGSPCQEDLIGKDEPLIHHAEGQEGGGFSHHSCKLGHAWHRHMGNGLLTPCDCTGHARGGF